MKQLNFFNQLITLFFMAVILNTTSAQLFETTIGDINDVETTYDGKALPNGNYIMLSNTLSFGTNFEIMLTELDPAGHPIQVASLTDPGNPGTSFFGMAMELDIDSVGTHKGYFITGHKWNGNTEQMIVIKTDLSGNMIWAKDLANKVNGTVYKETGVSIELQKNGDIIVVGRSLDLNANVRQIIASRITPSGTVVWARRYGSSAGADFSPNESCNGVRSTAFGLIDVVAVTGKYEEAGVARTFVSLINAAGGFEILRKVYISNGVGDQGKAIVQHPTNYYYMVVGESMDGTGTTDLWVANVNGTNGNLLFANTYDLGVNYTEFVGRDACLSLANNTAVIAGMLRENTPAGPGISRTFALELPFTSTAMPVWFNSYTYSDPNPTATESIVLVPGVPGNSPGGYFITSDAFLSGAPATDQHAIRVDGGGLHHISTCPEINQTPVRNPGGQFYNKAKNFTQAAWNAFDLTTKVRDLTEEPCVPPVAGNNTNNLEIGSVQMDQEEAMTEKVNVFPNPLSAGEEATLTFDLENESDVTIHVFDLTGRPVFSRTSRLSEGRQQVAILTNDFAAGTYYVQITTDKKRKSLKMHVQ